MLVKYVKMTQCSGCGSRGGRGTWRVLRRHEWHQRPAPSLPALDALAFSKLRIHETTLNLLRARNRGYYVGVARNALRAHYVRVTCT